jgi:hypothetical protein
MKKSTQLKNWLFTGIMQLFNKIFGCEKPEPKKNIEAIMDLLFFSNFSPLELGDSVDIFQSVEKQYKDILKTRKENNSKENRIIEGFEKCGNTVNDIRVVDHVMIQQRVKEHVQNPVFNVPYANIQFDKKN